MARIRTIKPEFWCSEQTINCSRDARLLFIGLLNFCDDAGVHPASHVRLKAEVFPCEDFCVDDIKKLISELISNDLLREYSVDEKSYWIVPGFKKHQKIDRPTYKHPLPQSNLKKFEGCSKNSRRDLDDNSANSRRLLDDSSPPEGNGKEWNGEEENICKVAVTTSPYVDSQNHSNLSNSIAEIFLHWQTVMSHQCAKLDKKREHVITQALKLQYSIDDLKKAIDGCAKTPFNMGQNDRNQKYDDIELIFRDASHIDRFIANAINPPSESLNTRTKTNLMNGVI